MTDERRAELLAKKAELQSSLAKFEAFERAKKEFCKLEEDHERHYREVKTKHHGDPFFSAESALRNDIEEIDRELDYEGFLVSWAKRFSEDRYCTRDLKVILERYVADRAVSE